MAGDEIPATAAGNAHPFGFTKTGRPRRVYKCRNCSRIFKRSEHCARHERVHTRERPFTCRYCDKSYARKDLVGRHERSLHADEYTAEDTKTRRSSHRRARASSTVLPEAMETDQSQHGPQQSAFIDSAASQSNLPVYEEPSSVPARRNSYPLTLSRMMSPSFFNTSDFPEWDFENIPSDRGEQANDVELSGDRTTSPHASPTSSSSSSSSVISDRTSSTSQSSTEIPVEEEAYGNTPNITNSDKMKQIYPVETLPPADTDAFLVDPEVEDVFEALPVPTISEDISLHVLEDLYFIPGSPLAIPPLSSIPFVIPQMANSSHPSVPEQSHPRIMREKISCCPKLKVDDAVYEHLREDIRGRLTDEADLTVIPKAKELERLIETYTSCFHCHFPVIHIASIDMTTASGPLMLSICVIGALYRLDRRRAVQLHNLASAALHRVVSGHPCSTARPLWVVQSCLLLSLYAAFSGNSAAVLSTVEKMGFFKIEFHLRRTTLQKSTQESTSPGWDEWVLRESSKRLLCGIFIMDNLFSVTYGTTPMFSIEQDLSFEIPSEEKLWDARTAALWEEMTERSPTGSKRMSLREAIVATFFNRQRDVVKAPSQISGFTALLITHAANVHMWSILQFVESFPPPLADEILYATFSSLVRWHTAIGNGSIEAPEAAYYTNAGIPLVFNCYALLRIAYVRLFGNSTFFNKMILLSDDLEEVAANMASYVCAPQPRSHFLTKSISRAYEGFVTPVKLGHLLIKKTAALSWSVEHAVAAWDSVLFVSKWVHAVQMESPTNPPDQEEEKILVQLKALLEEMEYDYDGSGSLAAAVTRAWAGFLTDTWVWGVTPRMGYILMQLAAAYDNAYSRDPA